jgi:hypothetical protein
MKKPNVFISWSGERSKFIADALFEWLPMVVQSAKPFMSSVSIDKGSRGLIEMVNALDGITVGISCLTPENLAKPWILYEAGCLSKTISDSTRLCTYLLGGLKNEDIEPPLGQFQHTSPNEAETRALVRTINKAVGEDNPLSDEALKAIFDQWWPRLYHKLQAFPEALQPVIKRSTEDMLAEILEFTRSGANRSPSESMLAEILEFVRSETVRRARRAPRFITYGSHAYPAIVDTSGREFVSPVANNFATASGLDVAGSAFPSYDAAEAEPKKEPEKAVPTKTKK